MMASTLITNTEIFLIHSCSSFQVIEPKRFVYMQRRQQKRLKSRLLFMNIANFAGKL